MKAVRVLAVLLSVGLTVVAAAGARAATFGLNLDTAVANNPYGCGAVYLNACTVQDPQHLDMELVLPDPVQFGDQTGVVNAIHVRYPDNAPPTQVQFVVVEWSGKPGEAQPFPSGVMALSERVTLRPGMNHFTTNLPVDSRFADNGFASWSQIALTMLDGSAPIPAQLGGPISTTGLILDNYLPLTATVADLTVPPHNPQIAGFYPMSLLVSGDVTITTKKPEETPAVDETTGEQSTEAPPATACVVPQLAGLSLAAAGKRLAGAHCATGRVKRPKRHTRKGYKLVVKSTNPGAGTTLAENAGVAITLKRVKRR